MRSRWISSSSSSDVPWIFRQAFSTSSNLPKAPARETEAVLDAWRAGSLRFVTCLSVETLRNLVAILGETGAPLLRGTTLVSASERVLQQARREDIAVDTLLSRGPEPADLVRAMILSLEGSRQASRK